MKSIITLLVLVFSFSVFAQDESMKATTYKASKDAKVLELMFSSTFAVNCPGQLQLEYTAYNGKIIVNYKDNGAKLLETVKKNVSPECSQEILQHQFDITNLPVCLSIGIESGSVLLPLPYLPEGQEEYIIEFPQFLTSPAVTEYK